MKLVWFDGEQPLLFDLSADPDELDDVSAEPRYAEVLTEMSRRLHVGWDSGRIAEAQEIRRRRTAVIRDWVKALRPEEPYRWIDPMPQRNRYED